LEVLELYDKGLYWSASQSADGVLKRYIQALGADHPDVATMHDNLAMLHFKQRDYALATSEQELALQIRRKSLGDDHLLVAESMGKLGLIYSRRGELAKADSLYQEALKIMEGKLGPSHQDLAPFAKHLRNLGVLYESKGNLRRSEALYDRALSMMESTRGWAHTDAALLVRDLRVLALLHEKLGEHDAASGLYQRALEGFRSVLGPDDPEVLRVAENLYDVAGIFATQGQLDRSERLYDISFSVVANSLGQSHPDLARFATAFRALGLRYESKGANKEAGWLLQRALDIFEESLSRDHPEVLETAQHAYRVATVHEKNEDYYSAWHLYSLVLRVKARILGEDHPDVIALTEHVEQLEARLEDIQVVEPGAAAGPGGSAEPSPYPVEVRRYPTMHAPAVVTPTQVFEVHVSLTEHLTTPEVAVLEGETTENGQLVFPLPDQPEWIIDVILSAPGFQFKDDVNVGNIVLPREGDSSTAVFRLAVESIACARTQSRIYATLWHKGVFLGKITRKIRVSEERSLASVQALASEADESTRLLTQTPAVSLEQDYKAPDLTLWIVKDVNEEDDNAGKYDFQINSPHLQPYGGDFVINPDAADWLKQQTRKVARGVKPTALAAEIGQSRKQAASRMRGLGKKLYREIAPPEFRESLENVLAKLGDKFQSIQILTNSPGIPWELMHTTSPMEGFRAPDFLGVRFRIARWHLSSSQNLLTRPPQTSQMGEVVLITPRYAGTLVLPNQQKELNALQSIAGYRHVPAKYDQLGELFGNYPSGIIHFAGHGVVRRSTTGTMEYVILLEDSELDLMTFRGLTAYEPRNNPFVFFNACEVGQSDQVANFVDGWAPALLESGASGYIGGLWPLSDQGAAEFAVEFYRQLDENLEQGPVHVADVLRNTRRHFSDSGDPTFLAYVYYGDPNFQFSRTARGPVSQDEAIEILERMHPLRPPLNRRVSESGSDTPTTKGTHTNAAVPAIILKDGSRLPGVLQKYENGLAYVLLTRTGKKPMLTTLPEDSVNKEATEQAQQNETDTPL
jgi:tetratricopeptide (TPR) repeat protein